MLTPQQTAGETKVDCSLCGLSLLALNSNDIEYIVDQHHGHNSVCMYFARSQC